MSDIRFQGFWRMDWGLGNPNKTAALIATLMIGVWIFSYIRRWGFWASLVLFTALGTCLIHTYSRGGLIAAAAGFSVLIALAPRPWPALRVGAVGAAVALMVLASIYLQANERYGQGITSEDRSISNRFDLWKAAPAMMVGAPGGWGSGKAGEAFIQWYQPVDRFEGYRTLVNSHLTWLVEFSWLFRFLYLFGWLAVLACCWPLKKAPWMAVALGVWTAFAIAAFFSSVAESYWLWIVPALSFVLCLGTRVMTREFPSFRICSGVAGLAAVGCAILWLAGWNHSYLRRSSEVVILGPGQPEIWVLADKQVLGNNYAKTLRKYLQENTLGVPTIGIAEHAGGLPATDGATLIVSGSRTPEELGLLAKSVPTARRVLLLSPGFYPQELPMAESDKSRLEVAFGEFAQSQAASAWEGAGHSRKLAGTGDFLPSWPELVFSKP